jgi:hypothetical protein
MSVTRFCWPTVPLENLEMSERTGIMLLSSDAHSSHYIPRRSVLDLPFARCPPTGELGAAPPNRYAAAVRAETPEIGSRGTACCGSGRLVSGATGTQRWPSSSQKQSWASIVPVFACSGPGKCVAAKPDDLSLPARSEIYPQDVSRATRKLTGTLQGSNGCRDLRPVFCIPVRD